MASLKDLDKEYEDKHKKIKALEVDLEAIEDRRFILRRHRLARAGDLIPVVCTQCQGLGQKDIALSRDVAEVIPCDNCGSMGYHLAVVFQGPQVHDMTFDERPLD